MSDADSVTKSDGRGDSARTRFLLLLAFCASATLFARGWLAWRWDSPIRGLFWQEDFWSGILDRGFGLSWSEFAQRSDPGITTTLQVIGGTLMILAVVPWIALARPGKWVHLLWLGSALLGLDAFARWVAVDFEFAMSIEHALQVAAPLAYWYALRRPASKRWTIALSACAALTFVGHGLYAFGFHPVPLSFQTMTMKLLPLDGSGTMKFLQVVAILDFLAAAGIWVKATRQPALLYMIVWGFLTALARPAAQGFTDPWIAEMLVRSAHWMLPLAILILARGQGRFSKL